MVHYIDFFKQCRLQLTTTKEILTSETVYRTTSKVEIISNYTRRAIRKKKQNVSSIWKRTKDTGGEKMMQWVHEKNVQSNSV